LLKSFFCRVVSGVVFLVLATPETG
jgi:hypothetical protein